jgi:transcription elongation factor GreA
VSAALNSRLVGIRRSAHQRLAAGNELETAARRILRAPLSTAEAALHILELPLDENSVGYGDSEWSRLHFLALLDLLELPPRESHRNRALALVDPASPLGERLTRAPIPEEARDAIASRLHHWQSSDRYRFPVLDFLRELDHLGIADAVEDSRSRTAARLSEKLTAEPDDPYVGMTLFTRPTLIRIQEERHRVGMELKTTIPRAIQKAREHGDLRENAEYEAAKAKQAAHAKRFEELEALLNGARLIEHLDREDGVALPGTEVVLGAENDDPETMTLWLLGEGDQEVGPDVVSYKAPVGRALCGRRVGDEVTIPRQGESATYRVLGIRERLP